MARMKEYNNMEDIKSNEKGQSMKDLTSEILGEVDCEELDRLTAPLADKYCKERNAGHINPNDWEIANDCIKIGYNEALDRVCEYLKANSYAFRSDEFLEPLIEAVKGK